ncbi:MAG: 50S ribosomal protein L9 [Actinomycetales bacterium]|nr:50S ribosomal protein L9 [Actinomycetales bacterium]
MKLILTQDVTGLGHAGEVVEVKDGYGRNYLLPRGFATAWTKGAARQVEQMKAARQAREIASIDEARALRDRLQAETLVLRMRAGETGRLFGAVTAGDVAAALAEAGVQVDRRRIQTGAHIKAVGDYTVSVQLHDDVSANVNIQVRAAK